MLNAKYYEYYYVMQYDAVGNKAMQKTSLGS